MHSKGFSLIELTAVLLIMAVAAAAVTLRLQGPLRRATAADVVGRIGQFDRLTRAEARRYDRALRINVDLATGSITRTGEDPGGQAAAAVGLPQGFWIARLMVRDRQVTAGGVSIRCSRAGLTPSYALLLADPAGGRRWLLVAGLTGQVLEMEDDDAVRNVLASSARPDAD